MTTRSDDELLGTLADALALPAEPLAASELTALRLAVAARWPDGPRSHRPWYRPHVAVAAAAATLVMGTGAVLAAAYDLERPVRVAAHAVGLPVDPPRVTDVRDALRRLDDALRRGDGAELVAAAGRLRAELDDLHDGEARDLAKRAGAALERAEQVDSDAEPNENENQSSTAPGPAVPEHPTETPSSGAEDHEDNEDSSNSGPREGPATTVVDDSAGDSPPPTIEPAEGTDGGADIGGDTAGDEALGKRASGGSDDEPRPDD